MFVASKGKTLAATITGSLPRPHWFTGNLGGRPFLSVFDGEASYREQYADAVAALIADQTRAGLDIVSDGEMRFDMDVGGRSWFGYVFDRLSGLAPQDPGAHRDAPGRAGFQGRGRIAGDIVNEFIDTMIPPHVVGPIGPGTLQYDAIYKVAQRLTDKPVKVGSCCGQMIERQVVNKFYKDRRESVFAFSAALNQEYLRLADAGCPVIQIEEPSVRDGVNPEAALPVDAFVEALNLEVRGLRAKTEVWCHTCWGNPFAQRLNDAPSYKKGLPYLDQIDVDVITFETAENGAAEIADIAAAVSKDKKICIGVASHRSLQVERAEEIAAIIRKALKHVEPERLLLSSDCGFGRQGMSRTHALYKMTAIVRGANIVRRELGLPETVIPVANPRFLLH